MKEIVFLNRNAEKWEKFEYELDNNSNILPDHLAEMFIQITDDLSYSKTYYPESKTTIYLNNIALKAHMLIYKTKKEKSRRILDFWKIEFPLIIRKSYKQLLISFIIFFVAFLIGVVSSAYDDTFVRFILGDSYINMTLENIDKGDPMAVYKSMNNADMFLGISLNNIKVSFLAFVMGIFLSIGTGYILILNGIMLGTFQYFFIKQGLFYDSISIWIHGTLEIFAIIVSGAAGIKMGNSILFPGTYKRTSSFIYAVGNGLKIIIGLIPVFIIAGFLEGFVTRYTNMPDLIRMSIIFSSLGFIIWYFFIHPNLIYNKLKNNEKRKY